MGHREVTPAGGNEKEVGKHMVSLSENEWTLMKVLWEAPPRTIMQLVAALREETGWSKSTVITMLGRLEKKNAVRHEEGGRAKLFFPVLKREEAELEETRGFLKKVYNGSLGLMVNQLVKENSLSKEEVEALYEILRKAEEGCK